MMKASTIKKWQNSACKLMNLTEELLEILGNRMKVADKIGLLKKRKTLRFYKINARNEILGK